MDRYVHQHTAEAETVDLTSISTEMYECFMKIKDLCIHFEKDMIQI